MKQLSDSEYKVQHLLTLKRKIENSNKIINHRNSVLKTPKQSLMPQTIKFSKSDILKGNQKLSTIKAQTDISDKLTKASSDLEAGVIPQILDSRTTAEKQRDVQLQMKTCMTNCNLLLTDKEQANLLFTHLLGDQPLLMFFNFSFPEISTHFSKKRNVLADTVILYIQRLFQVQLRTLGVNDALQYETYVNGVNATNAAVYNASQGTTNAIVNMGLAGINETKNMNADNIINLNNAGAELINEMRNNAIPQIEVLVQLRNEIGALNTNNNYNQLDVLNKLDALIAVVDQEKQVIVNVPPLDQQVIQDAFEQAYLNLRLPSQNDITDIIDEMRLSTGLIGEKLDILGAELSTITANNLEAVMKIIETPNKLKTPQKIKPRLEPIDEVIKNAITAQSFNDDLHKINEFAVSCGVPITTKEHGKQIAQKKLLQDINALVMVPFRMIRRHQLGIKAFGNTEFKTLDRQFGDLDEMANRDGMMEWFYNVEEVIMHTLGGYLKEKAESKPEPLQIEPPNVVITDTKAEPQISVVEPKQTVGEGFKTFMKHKGLVKTKQNNKTYKLVVREPVNKPKVKLPKKVKRKTRYVI